MFSLIQSISPLWQPGPSLSASQRLQRLSSIGGKSDPSSNDKGGLRRPPLRDKLTHRISDILRPRQRPVLKVILQNPRGECRTYGFTLALDRTHDFSAADHFRSGKTCDLGRQYQVDLELRTRLQHIIRVEE